VEEPSSGLTELTGEASSTEDKLRSYASTRDTALRDEIVEAHLGLVGHLARRFASRGEAYDDLYQAASIGLIKAVEGFDPELGFAFAAYATKTIVGELKRHFRDTGWSVRAPRRVQELYMRVGEAVSDLSQELGRSPTVRELAGALGESEEDVLEATEAAHAYRSASLDAPVAGGETVASRLGDPDDQFENAEDRFLLSRHLSTLSESEREIVRLRFVEDLTQSEIAARVGTSQMQVSRLLSRILARLHEVWEDEE
jgi:RNA polymerase sigma-B factor